MTATRVVGLGRKWRGDRVKMVLTLLGRLIGAVEAQGPDVEGTVFMNPSLCFLKRKQGIFRRDLTTPLMYSIYNITYV